MCDRWQSQGLRNGQRKKQSWPSYYEKNGLQLNYIADANLERTYIYISITTQRRLACGLIIFQGSPCQLELLRYVEVEQRHVTNVQNVQNDGKVMFTCWTCWHNIVAKWSEMMTQFNVPVYIYEDITEIDGPEIPGLSHVSGLCFNA